MARLAHKSSSKSAKRDRAPCLEARSAKRDRQSSIVPGLFNEKRASDFEKVYKMADWRKFKAKMKEKRVEKGRGKKKDMAVSWSQENDTLIIQRLSAEVSGKAQKYSRIGAREFVPYEYEELTIENIRKACQKHFAVDGTMTCDVVAGEQGPSCNSVKQIPDTKVIHVRFVERVGVSDECEGVEAARVACHGGKSPPAKRRFSGAGSTSEALNRSQPGKTAPSPSKFVPRSLSLVEMLKLGKVITQSTTSVDL